MNGKRAKALRARARAETIAMPERNYYRPNNSPTIRLTNCTRQAYKRLKRAYKEGR